MRTRQAVPAVHAGIYLARADQVRKVRRALAEYLAGCPAADDALLVASELASNAIVHSASRGRFFTVVAGLHADHVRVEVEDLGGPWRRRRADGRPHGLDLVEALTGPGGWGTRATHDGCRVVWARLSLSAPGE